MKLQTLVASALVFSSLSASVMADPVFRPRRRHAPVPVAPSVPGAPSALGAQAGRAFDMAARVSKEATEAATVARNVFIRDKDSQGWINEAETVAVAQIVHVGFAASKYAETVASLDSRYSRWDEAAIRTHYMSRGWLSEATAMLAKNTTLFRDAVRYPQLAKQLGDVLARANELKTFAARIEKIGFGMAEAEHLGAILVREIAQAKAGVQAQVNGNNFSTTVELIRRLETLEREAQAFSREAKSYADRGVYVNPREVLRDNYSRLGRQMPVLNDITENYARYGLSKNVDQLFDDVEGAYLDLRVVFGQ